MVRILQSRRLAALIESRIGRYVSYAAGEVLLIFFGITLALWFSNWNEERRLREAEYVVLREIAADLGFNAQVLENGIDRDNASVEACRSILLLLEDRLDWTPEHSTALPRCRQWTSPLFQDAAYESLRLRGTDLISNREVRNAIVVLYDLAYTSMRTDMDQHRWSYERSVWLPVYTKYVEALGAGNARPSSYDDFVASDEFRNALLMHMRFLDISLQLQGGILESTRNAIDAIESEVAIFDQ